MWHFIRLMIATIAITMGLSTAHAEEILTFPLATPTTPNCGYGCYTVGDYSHSGVDYAGNGLQVYAPISGTATAYDGVSGQVCSYLNYGNYLKITNDDYTVYLAHCQNGTVDDHGGYVNAGDPVCLSGNTGYTMTGLDADMDGELEYYCGIGGGHHLHFELRKDGNTVDPEDYFIIDDDGSYQYPSEVSTCTTEPVYSDWDMMMVVTDPEGDNFDFHVDYHKDDGDSNLEDLNGSLTRLDDEEIDSAYEDPIIEGEGHTNNKYKWLAGDVDGDGWTDMALIAHNSGVLKVQVWIANGDGTFQSRENWYQSDTTYDHYFLGNKGKLIAGRWVDGDGMKWYKCDIDDGVDGEDACDYWGKLGTSVDNAFVTGDFNGDGKTDIVAGYVADDADVPCPVSGHTHMRMRWRVKRGGSTSNKVWRDDWGCPESDYLAGNMNGADTVDDEDYYYDDLIQIRHNTATKAPVFVALSDGSEFSSASRWKSDFGSTSHKYWVWDVNSDGYDDLIEHRNTADDYTLYVSYSYGNGNMTGIDKLKTDLRRESGGAFRFGHFGHLEAEIGEEEVCE